MLPNLGKYDTGWFTLILSVLVARKDCKFNERSHDFSCLQVKFRDFRLVFLWCYFSLPATDFSMIGGFKTFRPEEAANETDRAMMERFMAGWTASEAMENLKARRDSLRDEGIATAQRFAPAAFVTNPQIPFLARARYFRFGECTNKVIKALKGKFPSGI
jgi:hypothetical protein